MGHMLGDQEEGEKQTTPPVDEQKGCVCTSMAKEGPNGSCSKDSTSKSKPKLLRGEGAKEEIEEPKEPKKEGPP